MNELIKIEPGHYMSADWRWDVWALNGQWTVADSWNDDEIMFTHLYEVQAYLDTKSTRSAA